MSRAKGNRAEDFAALLLAQHGYHLITRNFTCREGEIDLIASHGGVLCFVEVKSRRSARFGSPAEAVHARKQRRLIAAAQRYLATLAAQPLPPCRFDVVALYETPAGLQGEIIPHAFSLG